jgi:serine/threonine protein kinase
MMIDFGIAKQNGQDVSARPLDNFTKAMEFVGPQFFASPELIAYARDKSHPVDGRSDLFQLGKVLWFLATGVVLAGVPTRRQDPYGGQLYQLVLALLAEDPDDRPQSVAEVSAELHLFA